MEFYMKKLQFKRIKLYMFKNEQQMMENKQSDMFENNETNWNIDIPNFSCNNEKK